ncbi:MAG: glycosyltransferase, partial [Methylocystis sp.]|nr:glycosyltransferase [Methylocystis sp.]
EGVVDGETGFWFKSGDVESLAAAIARLKDDSVARARSRAAYDAYWAAPLTLDRHLDATLAVYDKARAI